MEILVAAVIVVVLAGIVAGLVVGRARRAERAVPVEPRVEPPVEAAPEAVTPPTAVARPAFRERMGKTRGVLGGYLAGIRSRAVDARTWEDLEEALLRADVGVAATQRILDDLRKIAADEGLSAPEDLLERLKAELKTVLAADDRDLHVAPGAPNVWLFVGVNGVGKTTTIAKVAQREMEGGRSVVMAAGDTFRAAAVEQLATWAERTGADIVSGGEGADPSAVVYDAVQRASARGIDLVLADTAGRFHTKKNLMEELRKVRRVADRDPGQVTEVLLVLDATTGQNGLAQAQQFTEAVDVTGIVLTKLDGSARGGIAVAIQTTLGIPIKLVGLGEAVADLVPFDADEFIEALLT
jgi:fused signal recognition particle receptor